MRKGLYLIPVGQLIVLLCLMSIASPAFASTRQATASCTDLTNRTMTFPAGQGNNQDISTGEDHGTIKRYWGHDQGNDGNSGHNCGHVQDNSGNAANQIVNRGGIRDNCNNQHQQFGVKNANDVVQYFGYRQGNGGNSGDNGGDVQDNSGNAGNQIIN